jgi:hypothetical protein
VAFTGLVAAFLVLVVVFFAFGEERGEDKSDDMAILWRMRKRGNLGYSDGRAEVVRQELKVPLLSRRDIKSREACVRLFVAVRT